MIFCRSHINFVGFFSRLLLAYRDRARDIEKIRGKFLVSGNFVSFPYGSFPFGLEPAYKRRFFVLWQRLSPICQES